MTNKLVKHTGHPFSTLDDVLFRPFDSLFDEFFSHKFPIASKEFGDIFSKGAYPKVNVIDHSDHIEIEANVAGLTKEDVKVELEENVLTISGKKTSTSSTDEKETGRYLVRELKKTAFSRSFVLNDNINVESDISADFNNGILKINIPKKEVERVSNIKQIKIN